MKAVVYAGYGEPPVVTDVPAPACPDGGAVLAVRATGVCRSDWHAWRGTIPSRCRTFRATSWPAWSPRSAPASPGGGRRPGDRAVRVRLRRVRVLPRRRRAGLPRQTQPGFTRPGSFAERVAVHAADTNLVALPDSVDFVTAASLGCRFATAFRALTAHGRRRRRRLAGRARLRRGRPVGRADRRGAGRARDRGRHRGAGARPGALCLGAEHLVDATTDPDAAATIRQLTGEGAMVSIDALGSPETAAASVRCLRRRGRHVQAGLLLGGATPLPWMS